MNRQHIPCEPRLGTRGKRRVKLLKTLIPWLGKPSSLKINGKVCPTQCSCYLKEDSK
jgi:hypothetical protein